MIPKIIHVTWFGEDPFPPLVVRCMDSWKKYLPDYEIMVWTKDNYDLTVNAWVKEAYAAKKYAFVSDFARFDLLYRFGGIYLDSDVEVVKSFDSLLYNKAFAGFMSIPNIIEAEVIGAEKGCQFMLRAMHYYSNRKFMKNNGDYDLTELPVIFYNLISDYGDIVDNQEQTIADVHLYPPGIFTFHDDFIKNTSSNIWDTIFTYHYGAGIGWKKKNGTSNLLLRLLQHHSLSVLYMFKKLHLFILYPKLWQIYSKLFRR